MIDLATDLIFFLYNNGWFLLWTGFNLVGAGVLAIAATRAGLILGPDPQLPPVVEVEQPLAVVAYAEPRHVPLRDWDTLSGLGAFIADIDAVADATTAVIARIPGATPQAGPVCPFCGAPFHAVCPSAPKERTDEEALTIVIPAVPTLAERRKYEGRHREDGPTRNMAGSLDRAKAAKP